MATGSYLQVFVQCPFYKKDNGKNTISCEGIVDYSTCTLTFQNRNDFKIQMETFCFEHYKKCELYRMLIDKYKDELGPDWDDNLGGGQ
ncbi:MAG: hypothetical protein ACI4PL_06745 [Faecousia sp.]